MNRATPPLRDIASRIILHESERSRSLESGSPAELQIPERLRPHLTTLMGIGGYRALLMRSLALASPEIPWMRSVKVSVDGFVEGFLPQVETLSSREIQEGRVELGAQLIGLLVAFIGEKLTLQLLTEVWPELADTNLNITPKDRK
ncbi:MAG: hypothetical protein ABL994_00385 [Verrucomicrobiales bacterium]